MKRLALLALACAFASAALAEARKEASDRLDTKLAPGKIAESCARMEKGEARAYHWKASGPVDFNIHYHRGNDVFYPVRREAMRGDGGTFTATQAEEYCWMWSARDKEVRVEAEIRKR